MAVKKSSAPRGDSTQVQAAADLFMQQEEEKEQIKKERAKLRRRKRRRKRQREERESIQRMHRSIEAIKWCIVTMCSISVITFVISIVIMLQLRARVIEIEGQVKRIQHVMEHPFATVGSRLGGDLDTRLKEWFQFPDPEDEQE